MKRTLVLFLLIQIAVIPFAVAKEKKSKAYRPSELRGSKEQRILQNMFAQYLAIGQILTREELKTLINLGVLIELSDSNYYFIDPKPEKICIRNAKGRFEAKLVKRRIYIHSAVYPAIKKWLDKKAKECFDTFQIKLKITSGARDLEDQISMRTKKSPCFSGYAAQAKNELEESLHVRGIAIDISRKVLPVFSKNKTQKERFMTPREISWMRNQLIEDKKSKRIDAEEELPETLKELGIEPIEENICYHIVVFPNSAKTQK